MIKGDSHASRSSAGGVAVSHEDSQKSAHVVLGVTGGIAAYKSPAIVRALRDAGCTVRVVPTHAALDFVGKTTWEAISGQPVYSGVTEGAYDVVHVNTGSQADLLVIAPATANTIAKLAAGIADNLLTATALVATCPILIAPAMHTQMWEHPATQANIALLKARGVYVVGPESGRLTGTDSGVGRMTEPHDIASRALQLVGVTPSSNDDIKARCARGVEDDELLSGVTIAISAGGTHEPIDPVRFIGNRSTGRMGVALANAAAACGAHVELVAANLESDVLDDVALGIGVRHVGTAMDLAQAMDNAAREADIVIMSAAVADYRPAHIDHAKIKKDSGALRTIELVENPDILADLAHNRRREGQLVVGFAAETGDANHTALEYGKIKAARKGADLLVINQVGENIGFGDVDTSVTVVSQDGTVIGSASGNKTDVAAAIISMVNQYRQNR